MMKTTPYAHNPSPVLYNKNIQNTQLLESLKQEVLAMTDDGIRNMLGSCIGTMNKPNSNHEDDFLLYLHEVCKILREELVHRTIGTKPHIRWNKDMTKTESYYDD